MNRHVPVRTCVVCKEKAGKRTLTRLVRTEQGVVADATGKLNGRGAYLCSRESCWSTALRGGILESALRVTLTDDDRVRLQQCRPAHD
jgi:predicted RNA-binding protein YlxR (DUF448 family)